MIRNHSWWIVPGVDALFAASEREARDLAAVDAASRSLALGGWSTTFV
jgi:hypothetical protein